MGDIWAESKSTTQQDDSNGEAHVVRPLLDPEESEISPAPPAGHEVTLSPSSLIPPYSATVTAMADVTKTAIASVPEAQHPLASKK